MAAISESDFLTTDLSSHASFSTTFVDDATTISESEYDTNVGAALGQDWETALLALNKASRGASATVSSTLNAGAATAAVALRIGATITEGLELRVIDEVVDVSSAAASFDLTQDVPVSSVILAVQANANTAITGSGASGFGIGISGSETVYGESSTLTQNSKIDTMSASWTVLGSARDVRIYATDGAGTPAGTIGGSSEAIRVRIIFYALNSLDDT